MVCKCNWKRGAGLIHKDECPMHDGKPEDGWSGDYDPLWRGTAFRSAENAPENVETEIMEVETRFGTYRAKRRLRRSDRQDLLHIVDERGDTFVKYTGTWFPDAAVRQMCSSHVSGRLSHPVLSKSELNS